MSSTVSEKKSVLFSSLGKKYLMGFTGLFLITFLVVHCLINSMVFFDNTGALFNDYAHFMGTNLLIRIGEVFLFAGLLLHIVDGLLLFFQNRAARPVKYVVSASNDNSKWYSRSMAILGTLLLMFLIVHLAHFWVPSRITGLEESAVPGIHDLYAVMLATFANPIVVAIYVLAQIVLGYHLLHGFKAAFQSLGLNHAKYNGIINTTGIAFSIIVPFVFAMMPIVLYFRANG